MFPCHALGTHIIPLNLLQSWEGIKQELDIACGLLATL